MNTERIHHAFSPSTLQMLEVCPNYQSAQSDSPAARAGTLQHAVTESGQDNAELTDEQAERAAEAMAFYQGRLATLAGPVLELSESYLPVDDENTTAGYIDRAAISHDRKTAFLVDYKFGRWAVEKAENNLQGIAYALGVFHAFPTVEEVHVHFFQPAVKGGNSAVFYRSGVASLLLRIKVVVHRAMRARETQDYSAALPTTPGCLFCANISRCPAVAAAVLNTAKKYSPVDVPDEVTPTSLVSPEQASLRLRLAAVMEVWAGAVKRLESSRILRGDAEVPLEYELVSSAKRSVVDPEKFKQVALIYLTDAEFAQCIDIGLTKVEKAISSKQPRGQKKEALEAFDVALKQAGAVKMGQPYAYLKVKGDE